MKLSEEQARNAKDENDDLKRQREEDERKRKEQEEKHASLNGKIAEQAEKIVELEAQVAELTPIKAEAETLRAERAAAELKAKQAELAQFAQMHGLDEKAEQIAKAIAEANYPALMAEAIKVAPQPTKVALATHALASQGMKTNSAYGGLLDPAEND